jgi:beta-exotoxin I transport system permease protein
MTVAAFSLDLRRSRTLVTWLAVITAAYAGFISIFYTNVVENAAQFEQLLEAYPKELLAAFGIGEGSFADPGIFLTGYIYNFLWPLVAAIVAIAVATRVAGDAGRGFLDVVLSTRLSRTAHLCGSIGSQLVAIVVVAAAMFAGIYLGDLLIAPDFPETRVALSILHSVAFGAAIAGPATLLAVILLDRGRAAGIAAGVLVVMYLFNVVAALAPDVDWIATVSAFHYFDLRRLLGDGTYPLTDSLLLGAVAIAGWAAALVAFRRRDLAA